MTDTSSNRDTVPAVTGTGTIDATGEDDLDVGYTTRIMVQALFPYRKPERDRIDVTVGRRRVTIMATNGLPYGKYPRLIFAYLITEAVKRKNLPEDEARRIPLGSSMNEFFSMMGVSTRGSGGARGTLGLLREQLRRIAGTYISVEKLFTGQPDADDIAGTGIASRMQLWFNQNPDQMSIEDSYLELSVEFYREIIKHPVPINLNVLRKLKKPRAMDIYMWLTGRKFSMAGKPLDLSWELLQVQFGPDTPRDPRGAAHFRQKFREAIADVLTVWPDAGLSTSPEGLHVLPGPPSVPIKQPRRLN